MRKWIILFSIMTLFAVNAVQSIRLERAQDQIERSQRALESEQRINKILHLTCSYSLSRCDQREKYNQSERFWGDL